MSCPMITWQGDWFWDLHHKISVYCLGAVNRRRWYFSAQGNQIAAETGQLAKEAGAGEGRADEAGAPRGRDGLDWKEGQRPGLMVRFQMELPEMVMLQRNSSWGMRVAIEGC